MLVTSFLVAGVVRAAIAVPWEKPKFPKFTAGHPGYPKHSVYTPPAPEPSWYRPTGYTHSHPGSTVAGLSSTIATTVSTSIAPTYTTINATATGDACASVAVLAASQTSLSPSATPTVPAELAFDCLNSIPFNQSAAVALLDSIDPYLQWQTTPEYLKDPPAVVCLLLFPSNASPLISIVILTASCQDS